jgi:AcrR family transcriptional regulator
MLLPTQTLPSPDNPRLAGLSTTRPLTANQQQRRTRILEATRNLVTRHGHNGMIMRDVAALAEVSATTLYNLYNSKDELLLEALRERVTNAITPATQESDGPGCAYLLAHVSNVCRETRKSPAYVAAIAQALFRASPGDPLAEVLLGGLHTDAMHSLAAMKEARELQPDAELQPLATALVGSFWSVFLLWDKGYLELAGLERAQLSGCLSVLIPAAAGRVRRDLEKRYDELNGPN